jgi:hypothetical protein
MKISFNLINKLIQTINKLKSKYIYIYLRKKIKFKSNNSIEYYIQKIILIYF